MIHIQISPKFKQVVARDWIKQAINATHSHLSYHTKFDVTVVVDDDPYLQELNKVYREIDQPTDVLSFEAGEMDPSTGRIYLGDIAISYENALRQANEAGHPVEAEMKLLVVHGMLHLLGFDHNDPEEKAEMWAHQKQILTDLNFPALIVPSE